MGLIVIQQILLQQVHEEASIVAGPRSGRHDLPCLWAGADLMWVRESTAVATGLG